MAPAQKQEEFPNMHIAALKKHIKITNIYPLVNVCITMENHHF